MKLKRGVSGVVTAIIMIALVIAASAIIWVAVDNLVRSRLESSSSCFDIFDKLTINSGYTCYDSATGELHVSIERGDIELSGVWIYLSSEVESKTIKLPTNESYIRLVSNTEYDSNLKDMPSADSSRTYAINLTDIGFENAPDSIKVYPVVNGNKCDASGILSDIGNCALLS